MESLKGRTYTSLRNVCKQRRFFRPCRLYFHAHLTSFDMKYLSSFIANFIDTRYNKRATNLITTFNRFIVTKSKGIYALVFCCFPLRNVDFFDVAKTYENHHLFLDIPNKPKLFSGFFRLLALVYFLRLLATVYIYFRFYRVHS